MSKYQVIRKNIHNQQTLIFTSNNLSQAKTVELALKEKFKNSSVKIILEVSNPILKDILNFYDDLVSVKHLQEHFINNELRDDIIYPCLFSQFSFLLLLRFKFNDSVNNYSAYDQDGKWVNLHEYPNKATVLNAINNGFNYLLN